MTFSSPSCSRPFAGGEKPRARDLGVPFDGTPGPLNAITDVAGRRGRPQHDHPRRGRPRVGEGPGAHRRHRGPAARQGRRDRAGLRRLVRAERQRRDDRHDVDRGVGLPRGPGDDHEHAQRGRGARRHRSRGGSGRAGRTRPASSWSTAGRRRDLGRRAQRHQRLPRQRGDTSSRRSTARAAGPVAEGNVGGGTGMVCNGFKGGIGTASRCSPTRPAATRSACWCSATTGARRTCASPACRWAGRSPGAGRARRGRRARSSSSSPPTRRCCRTS